MDYTKGKWISEYHNGSWKIKSGEKTIGEIYLSPELENDEDEANAQLICAAPDLLEAVRLYLTIISDEGCIPDFEQIELDDIMRGAFKKAAEGR